MTEILPVQAQETSAPPRVERAFGACLQEGFEAQVRRSPEAPALTWRDVTLSYAELNRRANRLAGHLRRLGIGPETFVGVCQHRSPDLVVSLLAVLKAGGAYVPLDPAYPRERVSFLLQDTGAQVLLTEERLLFGLPDRVTCTVVCPELLRTQLAGESEEDLLTGAARENLAYIIPTSGSTGRPKGVAIRHENAVALVRWAAGVFPPEELTGVLASTSICFDLSVFEIFVPLSLGGRMILADNALELPRLPAAAEVTLINTVPSAMAELARSQDLPPAVRVVNLAGEPLKAELVRRIYLQPGVRRVLNLYGPSEDTTYSTFTVLERGDARAPSIGRPVGGTRLYLLDTAGAQVSDGEEGEIFLAGEGLARGYQARPDLTAERFVPDPFGAAGERLYRTGDLGRRRTDGEIEFLGRIDHQVKIRGFRIELGEVEAELSRIAGVEDCVAVAREDDRGVKRLVAYVVTDPRQGLSAAGMRVALRERLPEYMVPADFVCLESLPLTPNGKVDRRALPVADTRRGRPWLPPRTLTEELLAGTWSRALGLERVGALDQFLSLGGDSISAHRVVLTMRESFGTEIEVRELLANPSVESLARRLDAGAARAPIPAPAPQVRGPHPPATFTQHGLWVFDRLRGGSSAFHVPIALRLEGRLDRAALGASLDAIVRRHEVLRTHLPMIDGEPVQIVEPFAPRPLPLVDLRALPAELRAAEADRRAAEELRRPFVLASGPLLRRLLFRLGADEHLLLLALHHIVIDGWSVDVLAAELGVLYRGRLTAGELPHLPEPPLQYVDYALWQRSWLAGEVLDGLVAYWRERLAPPLPVLDLPTDRPRPAVESPRGGMFRRVIPPALVQGLRELAGERGATLFMTLLSAFDVLLARWSGQTDLIVGTPILNRHHPGLDNLIGFIVETLALRADLEGDPSFAALLERLRARWLADFAHQDLPLEALIGAVRPPRDLGRAPLFQAMMVLNPPLPAVNLPGLRATWVFPETGSAKFDLSLELVETDGRLEAFWEHNRDLFDRATVERMAGHLETLLGGIARAPERRLSDLPLLAPGELRQLLAWNETRADLLHGVCAHELFETQADRVPERIAAACGGEVLTYGELEARANRLAHHLRSLGVAAEARVGICLERSLDMIVAVLAVLKAGGAYVPLDPAYPRERLLFMAEDAGLKALVTEDPLAAVWRGFPGVPVKMDFDQERIAASPATRPARTALPGSLAYVIYTSGSTGRPKGVCIPHRALVNFLESMRRAPGLGEGETLLALTTLSFDIAGLEILLPLATGARVVVAPSGVGGDAERLVPLLAEATVAQATPITWRALSEAGWRAEGRRLLCGGEALPRDLADRLLAGGAELWNMYGPTESTIWSSVDLVTPDEGPVLVGGPIANTQLHVLDAWMHPLPAGVAAELCIGGEGLARGYLNRPDLTAERFVPNPLGEAGSRLYRTGDLARRRGDRVEFLGRIDHQVKVRGFRIELGEIETALARHPAVAAAVVTARQDAGEDKRLVAYVVPDANYREPEPAEGLSTPVSHWENIWDGYYREGSQPVDESLNTIGWNSSYTGTPIPQGEMRAWVEATVERIRSLAPRRVLEIGCGTGMLLVRIAGSCEQYLATDLSAAALAAVERQVETRGLTAVRLARRPADRFAGVEAGSVDAVVLNSVVQYFPSLDYLLRVLEGAVRAVAPGGFIFVGDVRSLPLLEAFHTSVQLYRADAGLPVDQLRRQVRLQMLQEAELLLAPQLFLALRSRFPEIRHVEIRPRRGRDANEMVCFRYDVLLHLGNGRAPARDLLWEEWGNLTLPALRRRLEEKPPAALGLRGIPNARLAAAAAAVQRLRDGFSGTAGELREAGPAVAPAVAPEDLWEIARDLPYDVELSWAGTDEEGRLDLVLWRRDGEADERALAPLPPYPPPASAPPWDRLASNPAQGRFARQAASELRGFLGRDLPEHMIPASFVLLEALPLTANGKVDRRALPSPDRERPSLKAAYLAPRNDVEKTLVEIWSEVLGIEPIGICDNFFDLGGQSMLAIHVTTLIRSRLGRDLPLLDLLRAPTIEALAGLIGEDTAPSRFNPLVCLQPAGGRRPFFCVHGAGGQVLRYVPLARLLGAERPFWALQARGLTSEEEPFATVEEMANCYLSAVRDVQPAGPYLLGGYSLGGLIAYEMARSLEAEGERVAFVGLIDMGAEDGAGMDSWDDLQVLAFWTRLFGMQISVEQLAALPAEGRLEHLLEIARSMKRLPPDFTLADAKRYLRVHQTTLWATKAYVPGTYGGKVTLFKGAEDPDSEHTLGWHKVAAQVETLPVSGSHDTILSMPHLETLAASLREALDCADP